MKRVITILAVCLMCFITGCTKEDSNQKEIKEEVQAVFDEFLGYTTEGDYNNAKGMLATGLIENFAPVSFVNTMTGQYPESQNCAEGSQKVAEYILTQLYTNYNIEQVDVSQDLSEVRILMSWTGIDPSTIDTSTIKDTIDKLVNQEYQNNQTEYDNNTAINGEEDTNDKIRENCFPKVFEEIKKLYENAEKSSMKGVFCFSYITNENWKITGIYEYIDLMYNLDKSYNWDFEKAQDNFEKSKQELENAS